LNTKDYILKNVGNQTVDGSNGCQLLVINILQNNLFYVKEIHTQQYEGE